MISGGALVAFRRRQNSRPPIKATSAAPIAAIHHQAGNTDLLASVEASAAGAGDATVGDAGAAEADVLSGVGLASGAAPTSAAPWGAGCGCPADTDGIGRGVGLAVGPVLGRVAGGCVTVAEGAGVGVGVLVGVAVGIGRGATGTTPLSSTGPCARGVGDGEGLGGSWKSLADCAAAGAATSVVRPRASRGSVKLLRIIQSKGERAVSMASAKGRRR